MTRYMNINRRVIYKSPSGSFYSNRNGKRVYSQTAHFVKHAGRVHLVAKQHKVPASIQSIVMSPVYNLRVRKSS